MALQAMEWMWDRQQHHSLLHSYTTSEPVNVSSNHVTSGNIQKPLFRTVLVVLYSCDSSQTVYASSTKRYYSVDLAMNQRCKSVYMTDQDYAGKGYAHRASLLEFKSVDPKRV